MTGYESHSVAAHLRACEESLLDPAVRRDRLRVNALLDEDFQEFGSSGRAWTRDQVMDLLAIEENFEPASVQDFKCEVLADDIALVTYRALGAYTSLRSSLWKRTKGGD